MFGAMQHNHPISSSSIQITTSSNNNINYLIQQVSYNYKKFTTTKIKYARLRRAFSSKPQFRFFCQSKTEEMQIRKYSPFLESSFLLANGASACHEWRAVPDIWRSSADKYADRVALVDPYHNPPSKFTYRQVYEMWDSMIENVKKDIYRHEGKEDYEESPFYDVVHNILIERWTKNCTPLYCLAHSLNPKYHTSQWIEEVRGRVAPHKDAEISVERNKCLKRIFLDPDDWQNAIKEFGLSSAFKTYDEDNMEDRWKFNPMLWWSTYGSSLPLLQTLALKLLEQPCSSSCAERNWSTYGFIHCMRRNRITPKRVEDLVFVHSNLRLLSRKRLEYTSGEFKK